MEVTLYGTGSNRSARCTWTLAEAGISYTQLDRGDLANAAEVRRISTLGKIPVAIIDGQPLLESAAICTYIADQSPDELLISKPGSFARAQHDQWVSFCLTEMEAWLWNSAVNQYVLPEHKRITAGLEQNEKMFRRGLSVVENHLADHSYLVEERFTVTDIIVGWCLNWGRRQGFLDQSPATRQYLAQLLSRPLCTLAKD